MSTEKELQKIIDRMAADSRKASDLAVKLYGPDAQLFAEADGRLFVMDGDEDSGGKARQAHIRLTAKGFFNCGIGAW